jgi:hypothetical protein
MNRKFLLPLVLLVSLAALAIQAGVIPLKPGSSVIVNHETARIHAKGTQPTTVPNATAQTSYALDSTGTILTITVKNTSPSDSRAALYALDLALPVKLVNRTRMEASFSDFPPGATWYGPTDRSDPTAATGYCSFVAREAALGDIDDYLSAATTLPAGFLLPGQSGKITLTLALDEKTKGAPLRIAPIAYFVTPDPTAPQQKRVPDAITGN